MESGLRKSACYNKVGTGESPLLTILGRMPVLGILLFMRSPMQRNMPLKRRMGHAASREDGSSLFD